MKPIADLHADLIDRLTAGLAAGQTAVVVLIECDGAFPVRLAMRATPVTALMLQEVAEFAADQAIAAARSLPDGSGARVIPHLDDARRSLQAATAAFFDPGAVSPPIGRA